MCIVLLTGILVAQRGRAWHATRRSRLEWKESERRVLRLLRASFFGMGNLQNAEFLPSPLKSGIAVTQLHC